MPRCSNVQSMLRRCCIPWYEVWLHFFRVDSKHHKHIRTTSRLLPAHSLPTPARIAAWSSTRKPQETPSSNKLTGRPAARHGHYPAHSEWHLWTLRPYYLWLTSAFKWLATSVAGVQYDIETLVRSPGASAQLLAQINATPCPTDLSGRLRSRMRTSMDSSQKTVIHLNILVWEPLSLYLCRVRRDVSVW